MHKLKRKISGYTGKLASKLTPNLSKSRPVKTLFLVHNTSAWESLEPVYFAMLKDKSFKPIIASIDTKIIDGTLGGEEIVHEFLETRGLKHIRLGLDFGAQAIDILHAIEPDIIFRQSHWDTDIAKWFSAEHLSFTKIAYISYEMMTLVRNELLTDGHDTVVDDDFHRKVWRVFCANEFEKNIYRRNASRRGKNVIVTGHPKMRALLSEKRGRNMHNSKRRIIWSPHHSIDDNWFRFGAFRSCHETMYQTAIANPDITFIFAPHPSLRRSCQTFFEPEFFDAYLERWGKLPNGEIRIGGAYGQLFDESDALITDGISWLFEYQLFDKPLVFLERPDHLPFNEIGEIAAGGLYRTMNIDDAIKYIKSAWESGNDPLRDGRQRAVETLVPRGDIAGNILSAILRELGR